MLDASEYLEKEPLISVEGVALKIGHQDILYNVSLKVLRDDFITIIGPNGAGKSYLLRIMIGQDKITSGTLIKSRDLRIGYVPQKFTINQSMPISVKDFLKNTFLAENRMLYSSHKYDIEYWINSLKIDAIKDKLLFELSGGQLQRVLIARALLRRPNLLILDEPTQALDFDQQKEFYGLIDNLYSSQICAIVIVSHDLHFVAAQSKHIICLNKHICCRGDSKDILSNYEALKSIGLEELILYKHKHDHRHT